MNALAHSPTSTSVSSEISLSPQLHDLLNATPSSADAIEAIARSPVLVSEAARALPALREAATTPAEYEGVKRVIGRRFALFPQPERSDGEWKEFWADYVDVLGHLPEGAVEAAMAAWVRLPDAEFLPKPGKLLDLARTTPNRAVRAYERARAAMDYRPPKPAHPADNDPNHIDPKVRGIIRTAVQPSPEKTQAQKDQVLRMCQRFLAQDDERRAAATARAKGSSPIPDTAGAPDDRGLTPQMRDLLAKQRPTPKPFEGSYE